MERSHHGKIATIRPPGTPTKEEKHNEFVSADIWEVPRAGTLLSLLGGRGGLDFNKREKKINGLDINEGNRRSVSLKKKTFLSKGAVKILRKVHIERPEKRLHRIGSI